MSRLLETALYSNGMVGGSASLAAGGVLVCEHVGTNGTNSFSGSSSLSWWHFHLDIARVHFTPLSIPHEDNKLLVRSLIPFSYGKRNSCCYY